MHSARIGYDEIACALESQHVKVAHGLDKSHVRSESKTKPLKSLSGPQMDRNCS